MGRVSHDRERRSPPAFQMFAPLVGAALAEWQSVGFVFTTAGAALVVLGAVVFIARVPVGIGVELEAVAEVAEAASTPQQASSDSEHFAAAAASVAGATKGNGRAPIAQPEHNKEAYMSNVDKLRDAGIAITDDQVDAVGLLSDDEVDTLVAVKGKLDGDDEVAGHARAAAGDGNFVW